MGRHGVGRHRIGRHLMNMDPEEGSNTSQYGWLILMIPFLNQDARSYYVRGMLSQNFPMMRRNPDIVPHGPSAVSVDHPGVENKVTETLRNGH